MRAARCRYTLLGIEPANQGTTAGDVSYVDDSEYVLLSTASEAPTKVARAAAIAATTSQAHGLSLFLQKSAAMFGPRGKGAPGLRRKLAEMCDAGITVQLPNGSSDTLRVTNPIKVLGSYIQHDRHNATDAHSKASRMIAAAAKLRRKALGCASIPPQTRALLLYPAVSTGTYNCATYTYLNSRETNILQGAYYSIHRPIANASNVRAKAVCAQMTSDNQVRKTCSVLSYTIVVAYARFCLLHRLVTKQSSKSAGGYYRSRATADIMASTSLP